MVRFSDRIRGAYRHIACVEANTFDTPEIDLISLTNNPPRPFLKKKANSNVTLENAAIRADAKTASGSDPLPLGKLKLAELGEIVIEDRPRQDLGDLKGLARSIGRSASCSPSSSTPRCASSRATAAWRPRRSSGGRRSPRASSTSRTRSP